MNASKSFELKIALTPLVSLTQFAFTMIITIIERYMYVWTTCNSYLVSLEEEVEEEEEDSPQSSFTRYCPESGQSEKPVKSIVQALHVLQFIIISLFIQT